MHQLTCPNCQKSREVRAKKPWMTGEPPYEKICKPCSQLGRPKSVETKRKLSEALKSIQTVEVLEKKRQYMLDHPEHWRGKLKEGGAEEHCLGLHHSEEAKRKIGEGVKKAKGNRNEH